MMNHSTPEILGGLLTIILQKYFSDLYTTCIVWGNDENGPNLNVLNTFDDAEIISENYTTLSKPWNQLDRIHTIDNTIRLNKNRILNNQNYDDIKWTIKVNSTEMHPFIPIVWIKYSRQVNEIKRLNELLQSGLDLNCQGFVIARGAITDFMNAYHMIVPTTTLRYPSGKFLFMMDDLETPLNLTEIINHPLLEDTPNLLMITTFKSNVTEQQTDPSFDLLTTKYSGDLTTQKQLIYLNKFKIYWYQPQNKFGIFQYQSDEVNLYPDKLTNLDGRIVHLALFNYKPYSLWEEVPAGTGNANAPSYYESILNVNRHNFTVGHTKSLLIDGTESLLMLEFCLKLNCILEISIDEAGEWGEIYDNWTGNGVLGAVAERRADVAISALYSWYHEYQFLDFSAVVSRTGITCLVPRPSRIGGWLIAILPFSMNLWLVVWASFIIGTITLFLLNKYDPKKFQSNEMVQKCHHHHQQRHHHCRLQFQLNRSKGNGVVRGHRPSFIQRDGLHQRHITPDTSKTNSVLFIDAVLSVGAIFLQQSTKLASERFALRTIVGCILLIALMIGNAYSGGLASIMTIPQYEPAIDTVHQLAESHMEWGATHDAWIFSIVSATQPDIVKLLSKFRTYSKEKLNTRSTTKDFSFSIERLPYGHYAIGDYITEFNVDLLQLMPNDIYYEYCFVMSYKRWPLMQKLNDLTLRIFESGIQNHWELSVAHKHLDDKVQLAVSSSHKLNRGQVNDNITGTPISLSIDLLLGAYYVWAIGLITSVFIFIIERLRWTSQNKLFRWQRTKLMTTAD